MRAAGLQDPVESALGKIRIGQDDADLALDLARLEERLDDAYFQAPQDEGDSSAASLIPFRQARAAGTVRFALKAVCEAAHAHDDPHASTGCLKRGSGNIRERWHGGSRTFFGCGEAHPLNVVDSRTHVRYGRWHFPRGRTGPGNAFAATRQGFTGLVYVRGRRSGPEIQLICRSNR